MDRRRYQKENQTIFLYNGNENMKIVGSKYSNFGEKFTGLNISVRKNKSQNKII